MTNNKLPLLKAIFGMLRNYLKIALRTLSRQKLYSSINILSLSVGIGFCTLMLLFVKSEWSADRFHERADDIYRVYRIEHRTNGDTKLSSGVSAPLGPVLAQDLPGVEHAVRLRRGELQTRAGNDVFVESVLYADPDFFEVFTFPLQSPAGETGLISPSAGDLLSNPDNLVISAAMAKKYFGSEDPVGRVLDLRLTDNFEPFIVTGVAAPIPGNSSISFDFVLPYIKWPGYEEAADSYSAFNTAIYVQLAPDASEAPAQAQLDRYVTQYYSPLIERAQGAGFFVEGDNAFDLELQPLREVHFSTGFTNMVETTRSGGSLLVLIGICLVVLLLASVNFMTLAAGRASGRSREVGVRKSLGALRHQLAGQFFIEALVMSVFSLVLGAVLAFIALPLFNRLLESNLGLADIDPIFVVSLVILTGICGLLAGGYPALVLAKLRPAEVLTGRPSNRFGLTFTQVLVVTQFAISIGMIASMLVMYGQLRYVQSTDLGFDETGLVAVNLQASNTDEEQLLNRFQQQLATDAGLTEVTGASYAFGENYSRTVMTEGEIQEIVYMIRADPDYIGVMNMRLASGRNFSRDVVTDEEQAVVVNEAFVREFGWDEPIGHLLPGFEEEGVTVIGVVEDYHFQSLRSAVEPVVIHISPSIGNLSFALVRIPVEGVAASLQSINNTWASVAPSHPFEYEFMDVRLANLYSAERRWTTIVQTAAGFALLIACLGLFGLAVLSVERRRKEIGVRKVLGASAASLSLLVSKDFARLVLIAFIIVTPIAWFVMSRWLSGFAYHGTLGPGKFVLAGAIAMVVALLTVSAQSVRAGLSDPVKSLRAE